MFYPSYNFSQVVFLLKMTSFCLKPISLLPQPPECWDYRVGPPHLSPYTVYPGIPTLVLGITFLDWQLSKCIVSTSDFSCWDHMPDQRKFSTQEVILAHCFRGYSLSW